MVGAPRLAGKVALVCGCTGRINRAVGLLFGQEGARVVLTSRQMAAAEQVGAAIQRQGGVALALEGDPTEEEGASRLIATTIGAFGRVDIVYYGPGVHLRGDRRAVDTSLAEWRWMFDVNLTGSFLLCKHALPAMARTGGGSIILVGATVRGRQVSNVAYSTSKEAVIGLTRRLAREGLADNVRVNAILPTVVPAGPAGPAIQPVAAPLDGPCQAEDVAYAALYFASDEARFVTGTTLTVDGGRDL